MTEFVTPPPLDAGQTVAVVAPSSGGAASARHIFELGLDRLVEHFDVDVSVHPTARQSDGYLRSHPKARAAAIHETFRDPDVGAVLATIGGDDQLRVLAHLDPAVLRTHPTRFLGLSDNTNLSLLLWTQGIVSYNGVQLLTELATPGPFPAYTERYLRRALFEPTLGEIEPATEWFDMTVGWDTPAAAFARSRPETHPSEGWRWAGPDRPVSGRLWGGTAAVLEWQLMTDRYLPEPNQLDGTILALETSELLPSADRVRYLLTCMGERGLLGRFDGVIVGRPATESWRERRPPAERQAYRRKQRETVRTQLERHNPDAPVVFDVDWGHTNPGIPLPIGATARLEPGERIVCE